MNLRGGITKISAALSRQEEQTVFQNGDAMVGNQVAVEVFDRCASIRVSAARATEHPGPDAPRL